MMVPVLKGLDFQLISVQKQLPLNQKFQASCGIKNC